MGKRFLISNAHPIIPHDIITENLIIEGIKTVSPITFIKSGFHDELAHISSFRRQVYIHPDDIANVPGSLLIKYDNTDFRILLTDDTLTCFICKQTGHTSNFCKKHLENTNLTNQTAQSTKTVEINSSDTQKINLKQPHSANLLLALLYLMSKLKDRYHYRTALHHQHFRQNY